jgi:hypothetical protein
MEVERKSQHKNRIEGRSRAGVLKKKTLRSHHNWCELMEEKGGNKDRKIMGKGAD